jgi:hypothetical protein
MATSARDTKRNSDCSECGYDWDAVNNTGITLLSPAEIWERVDPLAPDLGAEPVEAGLADLPYERLGGPGFERLCYELLVAQSESPRFFGRSGQRDYGVDIIVEAADNRSVYQCKNLAEVPSWTAVRDAVAKFEADWLGEAGLPSPTAFVYCCPHPLDDRELGEEWTRFRDGFKQRTGVAISFWDKNALDTRLKRLPDLVAGLFSSSYAEHFCRRDDWSDSPWVRMCWNTTGYASIKRFLDYHREGRIQVAAQDEERFMDILSASPCLVVRGLPGSGKSMTGLELACRMASPWRRIYYATLKDAPEGQRLWQSVGRRRSLPGLFLLDDCHLDLELAGLFLRRLGLEGATPSGNLKVLLVLRDLPGTGEPDDAPAWLVQLEQDGRIMEMRTDPKRTQAVIEHMRPESVGLSRQRLERIHHQTGGDLLLVDEHLRNISSASDLDELRPDGLYASVRDRYFRGHRRLPNVIKLACLAQFDLVPLASFLDADWQPGEKDLVAPLMNELHPPLRYRFLHASMAELVLRALMSLEVETVRLEEQVVQATADALIAYLRHLPSSGAGLDFMAGLETLIHSRLNLLDGIGEAQIKARVLADQAVRAGIEAQLDRCTFSFLHIGLSLLSFASHPAKGQYTELLVKRFRILFERQGVDTPGMTTIGTGFFTLSKNAPVALEAVQDEHGAEAFLRLIAANGSLVELFRIVENASSAFREMLLDRLDEPTAAALVDKTIAAGCSIGTLHLAMRELGEADPGLLGRLEEAIGAARFLRLIAANGSLMELFRILQYASSAFREDLLDRLDEPTAAALVDKTIAAGRSIGTLSLAMRELGEADPGLLGRLEEAIGAARFLRLIAAKGTLFELFMILKYASSAFREDLLDRLDEPTAAALVDKTLAAGRSIGTLSLAMRELGEADPGLLGRLEEAIGAARFLRLIAANGTLFELFMILKYASSAFREDLLDRLDEPTAAALVDKTIATGRSIGTLELAMRELGEADPGLLGRLEEAIGAARFLCLIAANGTLIELFGILKHASSTFREMLLDRLDEPAAAALVDKTIATGRSIGTLELAMRELGEADPGLLGRLEEAIGAARFLCLIVANGTLIELFGILKHASSTFREMLLDRLDEPAAAALVDKTIAAGRSIESFHYTLRALRPTPALKKKLEEQIGIGGWWRLISGVGTLNGLSRITQAMSDGFLRQFVAASPRLSVPDWQAIVGRGLFLNACTFVSENLGAYPEASRTAFREALSQTASPLAARATWFDLNPSKPPSDTSSAEGRILREALRSRIAGIRPADLQGLEFREAVNGLAFAWRERPDLRPVLASRFGEILPDPTEWPRKEGQVGAMRVVLPIARSTLISTPDALRLLNTTTEFLSRQVCAEIHTLPLFLLLWNVAALRYERGPTRSFDRTLPQGMSQTLLELLRERVQPKAPNKEKLAQLSFAALLHLLDPDLGDQLRRLLEPIKGATWWLGQEAMKEQVGFVPAFFALEGIALLRPGVAVFTPTIRSGLLSKCEAYEEIGAAIEYLRDRIRQAD